MLALSAGADSTALFFICRLLAPRLGLELQAAHLNHGLRPEAKEEAQFLQDLCSCCAIPLYTGSTRADLFAARTGRGVEEAGRVLRYRFLAGVKEKTEADYIFTAHHQNDLAEDMLLRLLRGSGWPELSGMKAHESNKSVVRPLLATSKESLLDLLHSTGEQWHEDPSNQDTRFLRNRVRHWILPVLQRENPNFLDQVLNLWKLGSADRAALEKHLKELRTREKFLPEGTLLPEKELRCLSRSLRLRWIKDALLRVGPGQALADNLFRLERSWREKRRNALFQFPGGKKAKITRKGILLS